MIQINRNLVVGTIVLASLFVAMLLLAWRDATSPVGVHHQEPDSTLALVGTATTDERQNARLIPTWKPQRVVTSGPIAGRVTAIRELTTVRSGDVVIEVDGRSRRALGAATPLWRDLTSGTSGTDVLAVAELLTGQSMLPETSQKRLVGPDFMDAVRHYEKANGWWPSGIFKPDYVVWLPSSTFDVESVVPELGSLLQPYQPLLIESAELSTVRVGPITQDQTLTLRDGPLVLEIPGVLTVPLSSNGTVEEPGSLDKIAKHLINERAARPGAGSDSSVAPPEFGIVRLATPRQLQTIPTNAVHISASGLTCVVTEFGTIEAISIIGGFGGVTEIKPTLDAQVRVQLDPDPRLYSC